MPDPAMIALFSIFDFYRVSGAMSGWKGSSSAWAAACRNAWRLASQCPCLGPGESPSPLFPLPFLPIISGTMRSAPQNVGDNSTAAFGRGGSTHGTSGAPWPHRPSWPCPSSGSPAGSWAEYRAASLAPAMASWARLLLGQGTCPISPRAKMWLCRDRRLLFLLACSPCPCSGVK